MIYLSDHVNVFDVFGANDFFAFDLRNEYHCTNVSLLWVDYSKYILCFHFHKITVADRRDCQLRNTIKFWLVAYAHELPPAMTGIPQTRHAFSVRPATLRDQPERQQFAR